MKRIWKYFIQFFRLPKIIATLGSMLLLYYIFSLQLVNPSQAQMTLGFCTFLVIVRYFYKEHIISENMKQFLYIQSFNTLSFTYLLFVYYLLTVIPNILVDISQSSNNMITVIMAIIIPMCFLVMYLILLRIPDELRKEFDAKYSKYLD
jgi:hypothetical protein